MADPRKRLLIGALILASAVISLVIAKTVVTEPMAQNVVMAGGGIDAAIGLAFVLTGLRKMGES